MVTDGQETGQVGPWDQDRPTSSQRCSGAASIHADLQLAPGSLFPRILQGKAIPLLGT